MSLTVAQLVARLSADTSGFYKGMATANASMVRTGGIVKRVAAGVGIATVAMGYMALKSAGDFQQSMNILQAVSGSTTGELKAMRKEAIALGADLRLPNTSAKDAADAMVELSKGGLSVNQILTATRGTIQLSLAANEDLATSSQVVARGLKAFGLGGSQATVIANLLAAAANKSTAEFVDLELGIQNASAQFTGAGYNIQTLVVALAELADRGLNGSIAGTSLKYMLQRLESPTTKAAAEMKRLGVNIADTHGNIIPLPAIIGQFQRGMEKLSPIQKQQALNTIFGQRANAAMFKLVQGGVGTWNEYTHSIVGNNAAQKMAEARTKGFNGALQGFQSALETLFILLGTPLLGGATKAVHAMSIFIESLNVNAINSFIGAIFHVIGVFTAFINHSNLLKAIITALVTGFLTFRVILGVVAIIRSLSLAVLGLNAAMAANPVVLIIAAIVGLGVAFYMLYQRSELVRNAVNAIWGFLKGPFLQAMISVKNAVVSAAQWVARAFSDMKGAVMTQTAGIRGFISSVWPVIVGIFRTSLNILLDMWRGIWPTFVRILRVQWEVIKTVVSTAIKVVRDVVNIVMGLLHGDWSRAWHGLVNLVKDYFGGIGHIVMVILKGTVDIVYNGAKEIGRAIINGIKDGVTGLAGSLKDAVVGATKGALDGAKGFILGHSPSKKFADEVGKPIADGIIQGFLLGIVDLPTKMREKLRAALQAAQQVVQAEISKFQSMFSRLTSYVDQAFDAITSQHLTRAGTLLEKLITAHDQAELKKQLADANKAVTDAQKNLAAAQSATYGSPQERTDAIAAAEQALSDAIAQQKEAQYQIKIAALQKEDEAERKAYEARRALQKQHLDDLLAYYEAQMIKHPEKAKYYQKKIIQALKKYGITYKSAGKAMGIAFAEGLKEAEGAIEVAIKRIARLIEKYLRLNSPAETGPLSDLDKWWRPFAGTLVSGLTPAVIRSAMLGMAQDALVPAPGLGATGLSPAYTRRATSAPVQVIVPVSGNTFLTGDQNTARELATHLAPHLNKIISV